VTLGLALAEVEELLVCEDDWTLLELMLVLVEELADMELEVDEEMERELDEDSDVEVDVADVDVISTEDDVKPLLVVPVEETAILVLTLVFCRLMTLGNCVEDIPVDRY